MSFQEKNLFASILALIITLVIFYPRVMEMYSMGRFEGEDGLILLGKTGLIFIGVGILALIASLVALSVLYKAITGESQAMNLVDERDQLIERRGMQISNIVTGIGFVSAMVALTVGITAVPVLFIFALAYVIAELSAGLAKIAMYRLGW